MDFVWLMVALVVIVIAVSIAFGILAKVRMARSLAARGVHVTKAFWRINLKKIFRPSSLIFAIVFIFFIEIGRDPRRIFSQYVRVADGMEVQQLCPGV